MIYYGILLFFVLEYVRPSSYVPALNALHLNSLVPMSVFFGSLLGSTRKIRISEVLQSTNARWLMFFLLLLMISILTCDVKMYAVDMFIAVLSYCLMYTFLRKEIDDIDRIKGVFKILILVNFIVGALTPEMFSGDGQRHYIASGAFLGDGNDFALSVNVAVPLGLFMMLESRRFLERAFYGGILLILILAIVATQSRGGILSLVSVVLYLWIKSDKKVLGIIGIGIISLVILASAPPQFFERMETMTQTGENMEGSAQGRIAAWKAAVRMAADHPLTGVGAGHFPVKYGVEYRPEGVPPTAIPWQTAHSNYFVILGELGIPGIVFLVTIIVLNLKAGERMLARVTAQRDNIESTYYRLTISLNASMIAFAVGGAFLTALRHPHLYLLAALLECGRYICNERLMSEPVVQSVPQAVPLTYGRVPV